MVGASLLFATRNTAPSGPPYLIASLFETYLKLGASPPYIWVYVPERAGSPGQAAGCRQLHKALDARGKGKRLTLFHGIAGGICLGAYEGREKR